MARRRFRKDPVLDPATGLARSVRIEEDDVRHLHALAYHYHYLSPTYSAALFDRCYTRWANRAQIMCVNTNHLRLAPEIERDQRHHYWGPLFYAIGKAGFEVLNEHGYEPPKRETPVNLKHQVMIDQIMASYEIGVNADPRLGILWWEDIVASGNLPDETAKNKTPFLIPIEEGRSAHPDGQPFVLKRDFDKPMFFLGAEADTGTESFTIIRNKFENYLTALDRGIIFDRYNTNTAFIPFITPRRERLLKMMSILEEMTAGKPSLRKWFLFKTHPLYTSEEKSRATGHMVTEPFERVGYPPITLNQP